MSTPTILVLSSNELIVAGIFNALADIQHAIHVAPDIPAAERLLTTAPPEIVLVDLNIPPTSEEPFLPKIKDYSPSSEIILLCPAHEAEVAAELVHQDVVYDYFIVSPAYDNYRLRIIIRRALERQGLTLPRPDPPAPRAAADQNPPLDSWASQLAKSASGRPEPTPEALFSLDTPAAPDPPAPDFVSAGFASLNSNSKLKKIHVPSVLVIDDSRPITDLIEDILTGSGYEVYKAHTAMVGIELAREKQPGIILLDIMLPGMNGLEAQRELKKDPRTAAIPVVVMTSLSDRAVVSKCVEAGCADYIIKPFSKAVIEDKVRRHAAGGPKGSASW